MALSLRPYLIRDDISAVSAEETGIATYPFDVDRISEIDDAVREAFDWIFSCEAADPCHFMGGESIVVWLAVDARVATAVCDVHARVGGTGDAEDDATRQLLRRLLRVARLGREHRLVAEALHIAACQGTYAEDAEWTPLAWAEQVINRLEAP